MRTKPTINHTRGPERIIQDALIDFLRIRQWIVKETHGNMYQHGFPDLYIAKRNFGTRWVEVKNPEKYEFTAAQLEFFPMLTGAGVGIWILTAVTEVEYAKLMQPANWWQYLSAFANQKRS